MGQSEKEDKAKRQLPNKNIAQAKLARKIEREIVEA